MAEAAYREDLAFVHDHGFGGLAEAAAGDLLGELARRGASGGLVIDLGCGSGVLAEQVTHGGFAVLGIDISAALIALARARVPAASFRVESMLSAELPRCVAVAAIGECFNYVFDPRHDEAAVRGVLRRVFESLEPGGILVFDVAGHGRLPAPGVHQSHAQGDGWAVMVRAEEAQDTVTRHITTFREIGPGVYRRDEETHRLRLFPRAQVESWLAEIGFHTRVVDRYGMRPLPSGMVGYWAEKPGAERPVG